jgi:hypothetical protein
MAKKRRAKLERPELLDGVLQRAGENRFARTRPPVSDSVWIHAVGHRIAERARPVGLERGILTIRVATSVWASELSLLSATLIDRLRALGVEAKELRFRVGPLESPARPLETRETREVPPPAPLPPELAMSLSRILDDELKHAVAHAAQASLAWEKKG